jgi:hypothetical protein
VLGLLPVSEATLKEVTAILTYISRWIPGFAPDRTDPTAELKAGSTVLEVPKLCGKVLERLCVFSDQLSVGRTSGSKLLRAAATELYQRFDGIINCIADSHAKWAWMELVRDRFFQPTGVTNVGHPSHLARLTNLSSKMKKTVKKSTRAYEVAYRVIGRSYILSAVVKHWSLIADDASSTEISTFNFQDCPAPSTFPTGPTVSKEDQKLWVVGQMKEIIDIYSSFGQGSGSLPFEFPPDQDNIELKTRFACGIGDCKSTYAKDLVASAPFRLHRTNFHSDVVDSLTQPGRKIHITLNRPGSGGGGGCGYGGGGRIYYVFARTYYFYTYTTIPTSWPSN